MTASPMTSRQRLVALLQGRRPDRIPTDYWATPEFDARLKAELGCADDEALWRKLHIDAPLRLAPRHRCEHHPDDPRADIWGVRTTPVRYGTGVYDEVEHSPLAQARTVQDVYAFRWPSADDYDYTAITDALSADDERAYEAALAANPEWQHIAAADADAAALLGSAVPVVEPPTAIREALFARIAETPQVPKAPASPPVQPSTAPRTEAIQTVARQKWMRGMFALACRIRMSVGVEK